MERTYIEIHLLPAANLQQTDPNMCQPGTAISISATTASVDYDLVQQSE